MISGVPAHVDGRMLGITEDAGGRIVNRDRMWHYTEGIHNWAPIWPDHAIRIIPGPSSMWFDATGKRLAAPNFPGFDSLGTLREILAAGHDYSWFVLTQTIIEKEFALSGSEQNPDITGKDLGFLVKSRLAKGAPGPVEAFKEHGEDFVVADNLAELVAGMNRLSRGPRLDLAEIERQIVARDRELDNSFSKDLQLMAIANARRSRTDRLVRVAKPHRDPRPGPWPAHRRTPQHPDPQDARRAGDQPGLAGDARRRYAVPGPVRRRRGRRFRRRRRPRLQRARGHLPRRLHLLRAGRGARAGPCPALTFHDSLGSTACRT